VREKLLLTLDEMQAMAETALAFAREEATGEPTRTIDLTALLESLCDDLADLGCDVAFSGGERMPYRCRPEALRRAVRNLVQNAVRYGARARVALRRGGDGIEIAVDDDGPGIPEAEFERVFTPFVRLEGSRNPATGGVGLGLSIARAIARDHGGDIILANRADGGLRATIGLPAA
jgi:signal transduction histidine kinase